MNPSRFLFALRRWWPIFIGCVVIGLLAALLYLKVTPERYTARADVMLSVGGSDAVDLSSGSNFAQQQARNLSVIATRQRVVEPVIRRLNLSESADQLSQNVTATVLANTSIVTLEVNYPTAVGAATIANAMADSLVQTATVLLPTVSRGGADIALRTVYQGSSPQAPTSPDTTTMLTLGLAGGLLAGAALILLLEALTRHRTVPSATRPAPAACGAGSGRRRSAAARISASHEGRHLRQWVDLVMSWGPRTTSPQGGSSVQASAASLAGRQE